MDDHAYIDLADQAVNLEYLESIQPRPQSAAVCRPQSAAVCRPQSSLTKGHNTVSEGYVEFIDTLPGEEKNYEEINNSY